MTFKRSNHLTSCVSPVWPVGLPSAAVNMFLSVLRKRYEREIRKQSAADCRHTGRAPEGRCREGREKVGILTGLYEMCYCGRPRGRQLSPWHNAGRKTTDGISFWSVSGRCMGDITPSCSEDILKALKTFYRVAMRHLCRLTRKLASPWLPGQKVRGI